LTEATTARDAQKVVMDGLEAARQAVILEEKERARGQVTDTYNDAKRELTELQDLYARAERNGNQEEM
jgi:hypothetical protein